MKITNLFYTLPLMAVITSCAPKTHIHAVPSQAPVYRKPMLVVGSETKASMPKATAFRMSGDYSQNVAITPGNGTSLIYYPAPSDISEKSAPLELEGGWWLNRQGISSNSVFTSYTFSDYSQLPQVPSVEQLLKSIIPGAKVTQMVELPYTITEASQHIKEINEYLGTVE
ncbi:MAG: hypothetical protein K2K64_03125 [Muribaculaceae bacterium]|nr:hypothetical protein [Muribaculaceae bacterium]MDE7108340.1 hypothetical protein [Muribaculaceae bacterium]